MAEEANEFDSEEVEAQAKENPRAGLYLGGLGIVFLLGSYSAYLRDGQGEQIGRFPVIYAALGILCLYLAAKSQAGTESVAGPDDQAD